MKLRNIVITSILGLVFLVGFLRIKHLNFLQELRDDSEQFKIDYFYFRDRYLTVYPKERKDFEFMLEWMKENKSEVDYTFLENGYNIKYMAGEGRSLLYSFGTDGRDDNLSSTPFNSKDYFNYFLDRVPIDNAGFKEYFFSWFSGNDVILFDFQSALMECDYQLPPFTYENLFSDFQLYKGVKNLRGSIFEQKFKDAMVDFSKTELKTDFSNVDKSVLIFIDKDGLPQIKCARNFSTEHMKTIKEKLLNYLEVNEIDFFDHALFSLYITTTDNMLFQNLGTNDL